MLLISNNFLNILTPFNKKNHHSTMIMFYNKFRQQNSTAHQDAYPVFALSKDVGWFKYALYFLKKALMRKDKP